MFQPTGMDTAAHSPSPWELLVNVGPAVDGIRSLPGMIRTQFDSSGGYYRGHCVFNSAGLQYVFRICAYGPNRVVLSTYDAEGNQTASSAYSGSEDFFMAMQDVSRLSFAPLNSRAFFPLYGAGNIYAATEQTDSEVAGSYFVGDLKVGAVSYRAGVNSVNWPYVLGNFRARNASVHLSRVFFSGFSKGEPLTFNTTLSDDQRYMLQDLVVGPTEVRVNGQCLVWTDPDDPFAIGMPNFRQVPTQYNIVGTCSFRGALLIFTEGDVWAMYGNTEEEFSLRQIIPNVGCQDFSAIAVSPRGVYFANKAGIFLTDGQQVVKISSTVDYLFEHGMSAPSSTYSGVPFQLRREYGPMAYWPLRGELWIPVKAIPGYAVTAGLVTDMTHALVYNEQFGAWSVWVAPPIGSAELVPRLFLKSGLVMAGNNALGFCDEQGTTNQHTLWFREGFGGLELRSTLTRHAQYFYLGMRPMLCDAAMERFFDGIEMVWREAPTGHGIDSGGISAQYNTVYLRGEEYDFDGQLQQSSVTFGGLPDYVSSADKAGTGKWGTAKFHSRATFHNKFPLDVRSRYVRAFIKCRALGPIHLRGINLLMKEIAGPGDRE